MFSMSFDTEVVSGNMECQHFDMPAAESLFTMQKLEEILPLKEMQTVFLKLQNYSSQRNRSAVKDLKSNEVVSSNERKAIHELRLLNENSHDNCSDATEEANKREMRRVINGKQLLTDSRDSCLSDGMNMLPPNASGSKFYGNSGKGKQVLEDIRIEQLSQRLEFLEKESKIMKQEFLEQVEEREKLVNEVYQQFQIIYSCLQLENPVLGETGFDGSLTDNTSEMGEVDTKDSSPGIVTRDRITNILTLREAPEEI